jgi:hypothetical protein
MNEPFVLEIEKMVCSGQKLQSVTRNPTMLQRKVCSNTEYKVCSNTEYTVDTDYWSRCLSEDTLSPIPVGKAGDRPRR